MADMVGHPSQDSNFMQMMAEEDDDRAPRKTKDKWKYRPPHHEPVPDPEPPPKEPEPRQPIIKIITLPPAPAFFEPEPDYALAPAPLTSIKPVKNFKIPDPTSKSTYYQKQLINFKDRMQVRYGIKI